MDIEKLPPGEIAPVDSDCIKITKRDDGRFTLITSALVQCDDDDEAVSEAVIGSEEYASYDEAEQAGLAWAEEQCVAHIYVETA